MQDTLERMRELRKEKSQVLFPLFQAEGAIQALRTIHYFMSYSEVLSCAGDV